MSLTAAHVLEHYTVEKLAESTKVNAASRLETWSRAARTYGIEAEAIRAGRIWSGDLERAKAGRWIAVLFTRMARLARQMPAVA